MMSIAFKNSAYTCDLMRQNNNKLILIIVTEPVVDAKDAADTKCQAGNYHIDLTPAAAKSYYNMMKKGFDFYAGKNGAQDRLDLANYCHKTLVYFLNNNYVPVGDNLRKLANHPVFKPILHLGDQKALSDTAAAVAPLSPSARMQRMMIAAAGDIKATAPTYFIPDSILPKKTNSDLYNTSQSQPDDDEKTQPLDDFVPPAPAAGAAPAPVAKAVVKPSVFKSVSLVVPTDTKVVSNNNKRGVKRKFEHRSKSMLS